MAPELTNDAVYRQARCVACTDVYTAIVDRVVNTNRHPTIFTVEEPVWLGACYAVSSACARIARELAR